MPVRLCGDACQCCHTRKVAAKAGHDDSAGRLFNDSLEATIQFRFGQRVACDGCIGRVADHGVYLFSVQGLAAITIIGSTNYRFAIEFPISRMEYLACRRFDQQTVRLGNRVRHLNPLDIERSNIDDLTRLNYLDRNFVQLYFCQLASEHVSGQWRRKHRTLQLRPQVLHRADVVFVSMGDDHTGNVVCSFRDKRRIGHLYIPRAHGCSLLSGWRAGFVPIFLVNRIGEGQAAIDNEPLTVVAVEVEVHPDFATTAQRDEPEVVRVWSHTVYWSRKGYGSKGAGKLAGCDNPSGWCWPVAILRY